MLLPKAAKLIYVQNQTTSISKGKRRTIELTWGETASDNVKFNGRRS
ncbi:MAG: hypothetical protein M3525_04305 [Acidobacteriota bacterium]|nr:hypothetical protein [Acidobacteriota bacterium]